MTEVGTRAGSAAWLVFQHGWRWTDEGTWTRLAVGQADPRSGAIYAGPAAEARLRTGDLLVVDEAGMLDQDTARALLTVADEGQVRLALLGDRHQLTAVGRGGVLDIAAAQVDPSGHLTLDGIHRFTRTHPDDTGTGIPDTEYADLTLAMRTGQDPGAVFDALAARGQIHVHPDAGTLREALAAIAAACNRNYEAVALVVDTREQAADLNAATRERLVADGRVDDSWVVTTSAGQRIGAGDRVATRRNDRDLGVANRDTWIVTAVSRRGALIVTPADAAPDGRVTPGVADRVLPADYVTRQVELAYASTAHGVQGDTVPTAHVVIGEHTGAAAAYVGMTRGRTANTAHLVAANLAEAREQWIAAFARDRADLGPAHAAELAAREAARYAQPRPREAVLAELREAWTVERRCLDRLALTEPAREALREILALGPHPADRLDALQAEDRQTFLAAQHAEERAEAAGAVVCADAARIRDGLLAAWDGQRNAAHQAAEFVREGPGRFGRRRNAVTKTQERLANWADTWRPYLPGLPTGSDQITQLAGWFDDRPRLEAEFDTYARHTAEHAHPEHEQLQSAAARSRAAHEHAPQALAEVRGEQDHLIGRFGRIAQTADPAARWPTWKMPLPPPTKN